MTLKNYSGFTVFWIICYLYIWILNSCDIDDRTGWLTTFKWNIGNLTYLYIYDKYMFFISVSLLTSHISKLFVIKKLRLRLMLTLELGLEFGLGLWLELRLG